MPKGNSMTFSMEVKGLDEAMRKLKVYDTNSRKRIGKAVSKAGRNVRDGAKSRAPVKSGSCATVLPLGLTAGVCFLL